MTHSQAASDAINSNEFVSLYLNGCPEDCVVHMEEAIHAALNDPTYHAAMTRLEAVWCELHHLEYMPDSIEVAFRDEWNRWN